MHLNDLLEKLPFLQRVNSVLVCEVDHLGLRAAVINRHGDDVVVTYEASAEQQDFHAAVAEVVANLRAQGWQGKLAVLLTPAVLLAMLDLPIPQKNKLAHAQLAESINWELEPLITQHLSTLSLGKVLVTLGYMTAEQVEDVISQQSISNNTHTINPNETFTYKRFGEVAVELGYITTQQLQKCLDSQGWFQSSGDEIKCGWSAQGAKLGEQDSDTEEAQYQWLAAAVNQSLLRQWQAAFFAQGIKLEYLYPLAGCATSTLSFSHKGGNKTTQPQLLLEAYDTSIVGVHIAGNHIQNLHVQGNTLQDCLNNLTETYHLLDASSYETVWFVDSANKNEIEASKLATSLTHISQWPVKVLPRPSSLVSLGMLGAARHVMKMTGAQLVTGVPVQNPQPPLLQRVEVRAFLAGLALLLAIGSTELGLQIRKMLIEQESEQVNAELKVITDAIARVQSKVDAVKTLKDKIKTLQTEKKEIDLAVNLLSVDLPKRNEIVTALLNDLNRSVSDDVVIDRLLEDPIDGFTVHAWSINEKSAQEFVKTFQVAVDPIGYKIKDVTVTGQPGRLGLLGYAIHFNATTLDDKSWNMRKLSPTQKLAAGVKP